MGRKEVGKGATQGGGPQGKEEVVGGRHKGSKEALRLRNWTRNKRGVKEEREDREWFANGGGRGEKKKMEWKV